MSPQLATLAYVVAILGLFFLNWDRKARTSAALWIPVAWLLINGSRPVSQWLQSGPTVEATDQYVEGSPLDAAVFGILVLAAFGVLLQRRQKVGMFLRENWPILLFLVYCAMSTLWSDYSFVAFKRWIKAVGDVMMVLVVVTDRNPVVAIKRFLMRTGFVLIPLSVLFIKYYPNLGRSYNPWTWIPMYCGVTTFKNLLGMTCLVCGLGSVWCLISAYKDRKNPTRMRRMIAHVALLGMVIWLFWIANSMTSLSCFIMAGMLMVMTGVPLVARRKWLVHVMVAGMILLSVSALFFDSGGSMVQSLGRDPTLTGRTAIWKAVLEVSGNPFLGRGFESFWVGDRLQRVWDLSGQEVQEAHDGYLEVYLNLGFIGVGLLALLIVTGYRNVLKVYRRDPEAGRIRLGYFAAGVVYGLTEAAFRMMSPVWLAFLLAIIAVPRTPALKPQAAEQIAPSDHFVSPEKMPAYEGCA